MKTIKLPPYAPNLIESTRSIGYSFEAAVADIIDNSISANASEIRISFESNDPMWLCIADNGWGMSQEELEKAMQYGSQSSLAERRPDDLGRFGLGLKMASLSQCRKVTVITKKDGIISAACWDLDYITQKEDWELQVFSEEEISKMYGFNYLSEQNSGTIVFWENFDRISESASIVHKAFDEKIDLTRKHIALVFHRFINDENFNNRIIISMNGDPVTAIDPFLTRHPATQPLSEQVIRIGPNEIRVKPYVLPFLSKISKKDLDSIGGKEDLRQRQGFYIYRNKRLIIWGTWFRLIKQNELGKLARVRVDIPNSLDSLWEIDIKKSSASLPYFIKKELANVVLSTVNRSERVYKYRGRNINTDDLTHIWDAYDDRGTIQYRINRNLPIIKLLEESVDEQSESLFESFLKMLEDSFPYADVYYRMAKAESNIGENAMNDDDVYEIADNMLQKIITNGGDPELFLQSMDKLDFFVKYPDVVKRIRENYSND